MGLSRLLEALEVEVKKVTDDDVKISRDVKSFSEEFVREYKDIEDDEHLFVGAVTKFDMPN